MTTVPLNLRVSATETVDLSVPGDTAFGDNMAISVLTATTGPQPRTPPDSPNERRMRRVNACAVSKGRGGADGPRGGGTQTLLLPATGGARASARPKKKPDLIGSGKTTVAAGKTVAVTAKLNAKGRELLRARGKLAATLTVVAVNSQGGKQTLTRQLTIKPRPRKRG